MIRFPARSLARSRGLMLAIGLLVMLSPESDLAGEVTADSNWPTFRHDARRTAYSEHSLEAAALQLAWHWRSPSPPQPAWHGPAKQDAYAQITGLPSMRSYDSVFHVVVVDDAIYFGSSVDDRVYCLGLASGQERWAFFSDGPVRVAPTYDRGGIYFGSDDGFAYCIDAKTGELRWKHSPTPDGKRVLNDGRIISLWPCRTGVLVDNGVAYFGHSMLPWESSYLSAVDAITGVAVGSERFQRQYNEFTLEGPLAASSKTIISPQGRVAPQLFSRASGNSLGSLKGSGGGSVVVLTLDERIFHGPAATSSRTGGINSSSAETREKVASYSQGKDIVVAGQRAYMLTDDSIICSDWVKQQTLWITPAPQNLTLIVAGNHVYVGGTDKVAAYSTVDGRRVWQHAVDGRAHGLACGQSHLLVSTDTGTIYAFRSDQSVSPKLASAPTDPDDANALSNRTPQPVPDRTDPHLVGQWVFQGPRRYTERVSGEIVSIVGRTNFAAAGRHEALQFDGRSTDVIIREDHNQARLPSRRMTAEAWIRVDNPLKRGGIVGAIQHDDDLQRGWLLGFRDQRFCFAIQGQGGPDRLTYLTDGDDFSLETWYHVVGVYDGREQKLYVNGRLKATDSQQSGDINYPDKTSYEIGAFRDSNEHHRLTGMIHEICVYDRALGENEIREQFQARQTNFPASTSRPVDHPRLATGPWLQFTGVGRAVVRWHTEQPSPTRLRYWLDGSADEHVIEEAEKQKEHEVTLTDLRHKRLYRYVIEQRVNGAWQTTREHECDTFFNYCLPSGLDVTDALGQSNGENVVAGQATMILQSTGIDRGLCLVLGIGDGRFAYELARQSQLRVIGLEIDSDRIAQARRLLQKAELYGSRVSVLPVTAYDQLNLPGELANLVVSVTESTRSLPSARQLKRLLKPGHGVAMVGLQPTSSDTGQPAEHLTTWLNADNVQGKIVEAADATWTTIGRDALSGAGKWSHLYGTASNSAFAGEQLSGVKRREDLEVQWLGRPGPRYQADRNGRKPSPLSTNGRLFLQGERRMIAVDTTNGTILWSLELPELERFNVPRDCSNWCADDGHVYAVIRDKCWRIEARTGQVDQFYQTPSGDGEFDWGYISSQGDLVVGSLSARGTAWTDFHGGGGWYDAKSGVRAAKLCSDGLFSLNKQSGKTEWSYDGLVLNSTVTVAGDRVYLIESRNPKASELPTRRIESPELWKQLYMVALDLTTGRVVWDREFEPVPGIVTFALAHSDDRLVLVSSADNMYHTYVYDDQDGKRIWNKSLNWLSDNHGGHMSRPAIVNGVVYVRPHAFQLADGKVLDQKIPGGGCGTYACTSGALFFRSKTVTMWDPEAGATSTWPRLRPDCWLSTIPADGMLLSPEGGGGCSCGNWMETSIVFKPVQVDSR